MPGHTTIRVSTYVRGVTYVDSVAYTVRRSWGSVSISQGLERYRDGTSRYRTIPETAYVKAGGIVYWNLQGRSVVFEDSSKARPGAASGPSAVSGNIAAYTWSWWDVMRSRSFLAPDTIRWTSPETNKGGVIVVFDESLCLPNCPPSATH